jgi:hypothetical protein
MRKTVISHFEITVFLLGNPKNRKLRFYVNLLKIFTCSLNKCAVIQSDGSYSLFISLRKVKPRGKC